MNSKQDRQPRAWPAPRQQGVVLLVMLALLFIATLLGIAMVASTMGETRMASLRSQRESSHTLAQAAAAAVALKALNELDPNKDLQDKKTWNCENLNWQGGLGSSTQSGACEITLKTVGAHWGTLEITAGSSATMANQLRARAAVVPLLAGIGPIIGAPGKAGFVVAANAINPDPQTQNWLERKGSWYRPVAAAQSKGTQGTQPFALDEALKPGNLPDKPWTTYGWDNYRGDLGGNAVKKLRDMAIENGVSERYHDLGNKYEAWPDALKLYRAAQVAALTLAATADAAAAAASAASAVTSAATAAATGAAGAAAGGAAGAAAGGVTAGTAGAAATGAAAGTAGAAAGGTAVGATGAVVGTAATPVGTAVGGTAGAAGGAVAGGAAAGTAGAAAGGAVAGTAGAAGGAAAGAATGATATAGGAAGAAGATGAASQAVDLVAGAAVDVAIKAMELAGENYMNKAANVIEVRQDIRDEWDSLDALHKAEQGDQAIWKCGDDGKQRDYYDEKIMKDVDFQKKTADNMPINDVIASAAGILGPLTDNVKKVIDAADKLQEKAEGDDGPIGKVIKTGSTLGDTSDEIEPEFMLVDGTAGGLVQTNPMCKDDATLIIEAQGGGASSAQGKPPQVQQTTIVHKGPITFKVEAPLQDGKVVSDILVSGGDITVDSAQPDDTAGKAGILLWADGNVNINRPVSGAVVAGGTVTAQVDQTYKKTMLTYNPALAPELLGTEEQMLGLKKIKKFPLAGYTLGSWTSLASTP